MRVFVTGATGFVGLAVICNLLAAGHEVLGLARSDAAAASLEAAGAAVHRGALEDPEGLRAGVSQADGVIHTAFDNADLARLRQNGEVEGRGIAAMGDAMESRVGPLVVTSGCLSLSPGHLALETDVRPPGWDHRRGSPKTYARRRVPFRTELSQEADLLNPC